MRTSAAGFALLGLVILGFTRGADAAVSVGHSGWYWGSPLPQGQPLNAVTFIGPRGYAVGAGGTVLRSDDGGANWLGLPSGAHQDFFTVREVDPNTVVVGGGCSVRESTNAGQSFTRLPINESETDCQNRTVSFSFVSAATGYVEQADGSIFRTDDGGHTVAARTSVPLGGQSPAEIGFTSPSTGFAATGATGAGRIYRTTDGAGSWAQVATAGQALTGITFVSATVAYAVGEGKTLLRSTDGGATWVPRRLDLPAGTPAPSLMHIACADANTCLISTRDAGALVRTTDGGATGAVVTPSDRRLYAVAFATPNRAVAVGDGGQTVLSDDGGATFPTAVSSRLPDGLRLLRRGAAPGQAYVGGDRGRLASTGNGGVSWTALQVPTTRAITDLAFPTALTGFTLDAAGTVRRTTDGGTGWGILDKGTDVVPQALVAVDPRTVLLIGPRGMLRSTDGGAAFGAVGGTVLVDPRRHRRVPVRTLALNAAASTGRAVVAEGASGVFVSGDGGATWAAVAPPLRHVPVDQVSFVGVDTGYAVSGGRLWFTSSRGRHWTEVSGVGTNAIGGVSFASARVGYVVTDDRGLYGVPGAQLLRTADGGRTWQPQLVSPQSVGAVVANGGIDYALDGAGELFATSDGGQSVAGSSLILGTSARRLSAATLRRQRGRVAVRGRLAPGGGGEAIEIAWRPVGGRWSHTVVAAASDGAFSAALGGVRTSIDIVARWRGDDLHSGAGTAAARVTVVGRRVRRAGRRH